MQLYMSYKKNYDDNFRLVIMNWKIFFLNLNNEI